MLSKKEQKRNLKRLEKGDTIKRRLIFLKRYVKKGYTVPKILSMLKANDLEISKTSLYSNIDYLCVLNGCNSGAKHVKLTVYQKRLIKYNTTVVFAYKLIRYIKSLDVE